MRSEKPTKGELLPPNTVPKLRPDLNAMLKEAVEQKLAEILSQQGFSSPTTSRGEFRTRSNGCRPSPNSRSGPTILRTTAA